MAARTDLGTHLGGSPPQQQVRGRDVVVLVVAQRVFDVLPRVAHVDHDLCSNTKREQ